MAGLTDEDFPLIAEENRIYTAGDRHIATVPDEQIAVELVARLNRDAAFVTVPRLA